VLVVYAAHATEVWQRTVELTTPCSVAQVIGLSGFGLANPNVDWQVGGVGIFGKRVTPQTMVADGDRIEIYRSLVFDPKESRRRRARHRQLQKQSQKQLQKQQPKGTTA
jgi:hypothetical protein